MNINELVPRWEEYWDARLITIRPHLSLPLRVVNYTNDVQFGWLWNVKPGIEWCRGLIIDDAGEIVAWPMKKFDSSPATFKTDTSGPVRVYDKLDGSLLLMTVWQDNLVVATRGSFDSPQALWARNFIDNNPAYEEFIRNYAPLTILGEAIYPENRIVVNYGHEDIVFLGANSSIDGMFFGPELFTDEYNRLGWPGRVVESFDFPNYEAALKAPPRTNAEGYVVLFENGERLKIKQDDYLAMHRIVTSLSAKVIWEQMQQGNAIEFIKQLPDEFYAWAMSIYNDLSDQYDAIIHQTMLDFNSIKHIHKSIADRKRFAEAAKQTSNTGFMFMLLDNKLDQVQKHIWKQIEPKGE